VYIRVFDTSGRYHRKGGSNGRRRRSNGTRRRDKGKEKMQEKDRLRRNILAEEKDRL